MSEQAPNLPGVVSGITQQNFDALNGRLGTTEAKAASAISAVPVGEHVQNWGESSVTFTGGGGATVEIEHKLGVAPTNVQVTPHDGSFGSGCTARSATKIKIELVLPGGTHTGAVGFDWEAKV